MARMAKSFPCPEGFTRDELSITPTNSGCGTGTSRTNWLGRGRKRLSQCSRCKVWPPPLTTRATIGGNGAMGGVSASFTRIDLDLLC